jgi:hypothetical protein
LTGQAVEPGHQHDIAGTDYVQQLLELRAAGRHAGDLLAVDFHRACFVQLGILTDQRLVGGTDASVTVDRHRFSILSISFVQKI